MRGKITDISGKKFGLLTAISVSYIDPISGAYWRCHCDCGNTQKITRASSLIQGRTKSCGCLRKTDICRNKWRKPRGEALICSKYTSYRGGAKDRGYSFELSLEEFKILIKAPCAYCGRVGVNSISSNWDTINYNGIDRVDNNKGYEISNCVTCCGPCNLMKGTLTSSEFLKMVRLIANHKQAA